MPGHDIIVIGGSAGSIGPIVSFVKALPPDFAASLFITVHLNPQSTSRLPQMLSHRAGLQASYAVDGEAIQPGKIYIAPPNRHLLVEPGTVRLSTGPLENGFRPAVDALFRSAARTYGARVIGIIFSGMLDDGTLGLAIVKRQGGIAVVQDPDDTEFPDMPRSALEHVAVDYVLRAEDLADLIVKLTQATDPITAPAEETQSTMRNDTDTALNEEIQHYSPLFFSCPACGGVLSPRWDGTLIHYECEVKHTYSLQALANQQSEALERALWAGMRGLEEKARLATQIAENAQTQRNSETSELFSERAQVAREQANLLRQLIGRLT
jgi:two-component system chemotaxis response regulator CheB